MRERVGGCVGRLARLQMSERQLRRLQGHQVPASPHRLLENNLGTISENIRNVLIKVKEWDLTIVELLLSLGYSNYWIELRKTS